MSDSMDHILEQRDQHTAALRAALKLYPDLHYEGRYLVSAKLQRHDCNRIFIVPGEKGDLIRLGKKVGDVTVLCSSQEWLSMPVSSLFWGLKERHPGLYAQLIKLLADSRGML